MIKNIFRVGITTLLSCAVVLALTACGKEEESVPIQTSTIRSVDNVEFKIPSVLRENKTSYAEFYVNQSSIDNHFDTGVIEELSPDLYLITDRKSFYIEVGHDTAFEESLYYLYGPEEVSSCIKGIGITEDFNVFGPVFTYEDNESLRLSCEANFTVPFGSDTVSDNLMGSCAVMEHHGEQYYMICGFNGEVFDTSTVSDVVTSFVYTGEDSDLYSEDNMDYLGERGGQVGIPICKDMFIETEEGWQIPSCGASFDYSISLVDTDHELTRIEQEKNVPKDENINYDPLISRKCAGKDGVIWNVLTYTINVDQSNVYETDCIASKGRTMCCFSFKYANDPEYMSNMACDMFSYSNITGYTGLDGTVVEGVTTTEETTTEVTTEKPTEAITEATTEATTDITTEATTQAPTTTEATTEITTQATTTEAPTTQATTEVTTQATTQAKKQTSTQTTTQSKKKSSKKKNTSSDLDVEW